MAGSGATIFSPLTGVAKLVRGAKYPIYIKN